MDPEYRGLGIAGSILRRLEETARSEGQPCVRLEVGVHQPAALHLYRGAGYVERTPFGEYSHDPLSVFMEKRLTGESVCRAG